MQIRGGKWDFLGNITLPKAGWVLGSRGGLGGGLTSEYCRIVEVDDLIGALHPLVITINDKFGTKLSTNSIFDSLKVVSESRETLGLKDFWVNTEVTEFLQIYEALSISEASVERLFSYLGRCTENKRRNSILPKTLESLGHMYVKKR